MLTFDITSRTTRHTFEGDSVFGEKSFGSVVDLSYDLPFGFSPDSRLLAMGTKYGTISLWQVATGKRHRQMEAHFDNKIIQWTAAIGVDFPGCEVSFSPDGKLIAAASISFTVLLWDVGTGKIRRRLNGHTATVRTLRFSYDNKFLITFSRDNSLRVWDAASTSLIDTYKPDKESEKLEGTALLPDRSVIAVLSNDNGKAMVEVWDMENLSSEVWASFQAHDKTANSIDFSPDGKIIATASVDGSIKLWDAANKKLHQKVHGHDGGVDIVQFSSDGNLLACALDEGIKVLRKE